MKYRFLTLLTVVLLISSHLESHAVQEEVATVSADGFGFIKKGNVPNARAAAIKNAFSKVLKNVVASLISEETIKQNHVVLEENIYTMSQTFIQNYSVVKEKAIGNMYQLTIKADIAAKRLKATLAKEGLYHLESKMQKVLLIIAKQDRSTGELLLLLPEKKNNDEKYATEALFSQYLEKSGFQVIKFSNNESFNSKVYSANDLLTDEVMKKVGTNYNVDLVSFIRLLDNSSSYDSEDRSPGSASVLITAKVIDAKTGELVFSDISRGMDFGSESEKALGRAVNNAATPLLSKMSSVIINKKISIDKILSLVHMTVSGLESYDDFIRFQKAMEEKVRNIDSIEPRGFSSGKAALDVSIKGTTEELSDALTMIFDTGFNLDIVDYGADYIQLNMNTLKTSE